MMTAKKPTRIEKDVAGKKLVVVREFDAPLHQVWKAWTESDLLDQWWAPKPYKTETKTMDFYEGGRWLYAMVGPDSSRSWCLADFKTIIPEKSFTMKEGFCDEKGNITPDFPLMSWVVSFAQVDHCTAVTVEITFDKEEDLNKIVEMGFEQGFTAAHGNLDEL
ncbi:MAG TPA: SRPBCC domain-containing protein, partial [Flavisolibacter sp.]|nr:SRPBCC domain-containing protein [Flavisolibacter sp.]